MTHSEKATITHENTMTGIANTYPAATEEQRELAAFQIIADMVESREIKAPESALTASSAKNSEIFTNAENMALGYSPNVSITRREEDESAKEWKARTAQYREDENFIVISTIVLQVLPAYQFLESLPQFGSTITVS